MAFSFDTMSDDELLSLAQGMGIDVSPFLTSGGGIADALGQVPSFAEAVSIPDSVRQEVSNVFGAQRSLGQEEIQRAAIEAAGGRGLNLTDTPIFGPMTRANALLESQLRGGESSALLGLAQGAREFREKQLMGRGGFQETIRQFQQQFQNQLRQQAFQNRLALSGQLAQTGLGLNAARMGTPMSTTTVGPLNLGPGLAAIGLGLSGMRGSGSGFFS